MKNQQMVRKARERAEKAHKGQTRKGSDEPYFNHPVAVAGLTKESGGDDYAVVAAYLHDVLEDTDYKIVDFPKAVQETVQLLTKAKGEPKTEGIKRLGNDYRAVLVKMADRVHNLSDESEYKDKYFNKPTVQMSTRMLLEKAEELDLENTSVYKRLKSLF